jgi:hypothetical protein
MFVGEHQECTTNDRKGAPISNIGGAFQVFNDSDASVHCAIYNKQGTDESLDAIKSFH